MKHTRPIGRRQPATGHGFTLIEIMLVVVIILIASSISVPLFRGTFRSTQMKDALRSTVRMARYARSQAILKQEDIALTFKGQQITISGSDTNATGTIITRRLPNDISITEFENLSIDEEPSEEDGYRVHYYSNGMNDGFTLTLTDNRERRTEIACDPITGNVKVGE